MGLSSVAGKYDLNKNEKVGILNLLEWDGCDRVLTN
jgi:hypothetical protein